MRGDGPGDGTLGLLRGPALAVLGRLDAFRQPGCPPDDRLPQRLREALDADLLLVGVGRVDELGDLSDEAVDDVLGRVGVAADEHAQHRRRLDPDQTVVGVEVFEQCRVGGAGSAFGRGWGDEQGYPLVVI